MNLFKKLLPDVVVIVLFALISFAYFYPAVNEGRILAQHDAVAGIGSGREMSEYLEKTGERTRWTNSILEECLPTRCLRAMTLPIRWAGFNRYIICSCLLTCGMYLSCCWVSTSFACI